MHATDVTSVRIAGAPLTDTDPTPVSLAADIYLPARTPAPAVILAHGFGGSRLSVAGQAQQLAAAGFVVAAYTARGFGDSSGTISMNAPRFEVADAARVVDYLARLPGVQLDGPGDPVVGVAGGSYGGALALLLAGVDDRVDAVAADITWHSLADSLLAQQRIGAGQPGVYKQLWTSTFFSAGLASPPGRADECGRFSPQWCAAYTTIATTGTVTPQISALMAASSPASVADRITAPTLLGGGQADSLFPLAQVNATAEHIMRAHPATPVKVVWHAQGHDGGVDESARWQDLTRAWLLAHLADGPPVARDFEASLVAGSALSDRQAGTVVVLTSPSYPGLDGDTTVPIAIDGPAQQVLAPAGGVPAAVSSLPGIGAAGGLLGVLGAGLAANQTAVFPAAPLTAPVRVIGAPRVAITVASAEPVRDVVLFVALRIRTGAGATVLPAGLVSPVRVDEVGPTPQVIDVELPAIVADIAAGDALVLTVGTTDQGYRLPTGPAVYTIGLLPGATVVLPQVAMTAAGAPLPVWVWLVLALGVCLLSAGVLRLLRPRDRPGGRTSAPSAPSPSAPSPSAPSPSLPLQISGLVKQFPRGVRAVAGVTVEVPPGVVLGLLGPNGAGKTTTLRMAMGLIRPTAGEVRVFGEPVAPGAPVLARIGAFIEGPGFLPHLSGRENLSLYWRASGRDRTEAHLAEVLDIAGLGAAVARPVRTYSHGMKQRLGIAQAMLGLPELLLLDEPTNGLDPPQIRHMREVLRAYAGDGRTVILSSHLLSEVEQTCSHVVVMHRGTVIAFGTVTELLAGRAHLEDVFMELVGSDHLANSGPLAQPPAAAHR